MRRPLLCRCFAGPRASRRSRSGRGTPRGRAWRRGGSCVGAGEVGGVRRGQIPQPCERRDSVVRGAIGATACVRVAQEVDPHRVETRGLAVGEETVSLLLGQSSRSATAVSRPRSGTAGRSGRPGSVPSARPSAGSWASRRQQLGGCRRLHARVAARSALCVLRCEADDCHGAGDRKSGEQPPMARDDRPDLMQGPAVIGRPCRFSASRHTRPTSSTRPSVCTVTEP